VTDRVARNAVEFIANGYARGRLPRKVSPKEEVELRSQVTVIGLGKHTEETLKGGRRFSHRIRGGGCSRCGDEELVEPVDEAWRRSDEVPGTGRDQPLGIEDCGERVADPLQPWSVTARGHQRGDARAPY
jgi:hypothetical protein